MLSKSFFTAGLATFTVEVSEEYRSKPNNSNFHPHYTYRIETSEFNGRLYYLVSSLTGTDNTKDYAYLGKFNDFTGEVSLTAKSSFPADATRVVVIQRVMKAIWEGRGAAIEEAGWKVHHEGACGRCGRALTVPASIESGIGPECSKILGITSPKPIPVPTVPATAKKEEKVNEVAAKAPEARSATPSTEKRPTAKKAKPSSGKPTPKAPITEPFTEKTGSAWVVEISDHPEIDVSKLTPVYSGEGSDRELSGWKGTLNGQAVVVLND